MKNGEFTNGDFFKEKKDTITNLLDGKESAFEVFSQTIQAENIRFEEKPFSVENLTIITKTIEKVNSSISQEACLDFKSQKTSPHSLS